jgi:hypothetical protein
VLFEPGLQRCEKKVIRLTTFVPEPKFLGHTDRNFWEKDRDAILIALRSIESLASNLIYTGLRECACYGLREQRAVRPLFHKHTFTDNSLKVIPSNIIVQPVDLRVLLNTVQ